LAKVYNSSYEGFARETGASAQVAVAQNHITEEPSWGGFRSNKASAGSLHGEYTYNVGRGHTRTASDIYEGAYSEGE